MPSAPTLSSGGPTVAIIGAGPAGVVLALTLQKHNIATRIYELRQNSYSVGGSISLQPNGLRILDAIGIESHIRSQGFSFEAVTIRNLDTGSVVAEGAGIEAAYGYKGLRIRRRVLIDELRAAAVERGIAIEYGFRFSHVVSEDQRTGVVTFASVDGITCKADLLVGADGIHSMVREHIASVTPEYTGLLGLGSMAPTAALRLPEATNPNHADEWKLPLNLRGNGTAVGILPEMPDGSYVSVLKGTKLPERSREAWEKLYNDKETSYALLCEGLDDLPDVVRSAVESVDLANFIYWPVYQLPRLENWVSKGGRVLILGDAAHAVSPSTGQGSNQAFEDAYMLGEVLGKAQEKSLSEALGFWQDKRMERVYGMIDRYLGKHSAGKDPIELRSSKPNSEEDTEVRGDHWLYGMDLDETVNAWVAGTG